MWTRFQLPQSTFSLLLSGKFINIEKKEENNKFWHVQYWRKKGKPAISWVLVGNTNKKPGQKRIDKSQSEAVIIKCQPHELSFRRLKKQKEGTPLLPLLLVITMTQRGNADSINLACGLPLAAHKSDVYRGYGFNPFQRRTFKCNQFETRYKKKERMFRFAVWIHRGTPTRHTVFMFSLRFRPRYQMIWDTCNFTFLLRFDDKSVIDI